MGRLINTFWKVQRELNRLLAVSVFAVLVIMWANTVENPWHLKWAHDFGDVMSNFFLSFIASYVFFFVGEIWLRQRRVVVMKDSVRKITFLAVNDYEQFLAEHDTPRRHPNFTNSPIWTETEVQLLSRFNAMLTRIAKSKGQQVEERLVLDMVKILRARHVSMMMNTDVINLNGMVHLFEISDHFEANIPNLTGGHAEIMVKGILHFRDFNKGLQNMLSERW